MESNNFIDPSVLQMQHMNGWNTEATSASADKWWFGITDTNVKDTLNSYSSSVNSVKNWGTATNWYWSTTWSWWSTTTTKNITSSGSDDCWHKEQIESLNQQISELNEEKSRLESENKKLEEEKTKLENEVASLTAQNEELNSQVSSLKSKLNAKENSDDFDETIQSKAEEYNNADVWVTTEANVNNDTITEDTAEPTIENNAESTETSVTTTTPQSKISNSLSRLWYNLNQTNVTSDAAKEQEPTLASNIITSLDNIVSEWWSVSDMKIKAADILTWLKEQLRNSNITQQEYEDLKSQITNHNVFKL